MNKVIISGRLTTDPEVRFTKKNKAVAQFTVAVSRYLGSTEVDFIPVVVWDKLAEIVGNSIVKGQKVLVEGRMQIRNYETNDRQKRRVAEVIAATIEFLEKKKGTASGVESLGSEVFPDEEIPF